MTERAIVHRYEDPLDALWVGTAAHIGLRIARSAEVYASTDGRGHLTIGDAATLDPDDCLAQMIFHELCHSLVQGPESFERADWGLENDDARDLHREHACLRAQATLARRYGLGAVLAPTTEHRAFYDALGVDPLAGDGPSVPLARNAVRRATRDPWAPHLERALATSATILGAVSPFVTAGSLLSRLEPSAAPHPTGLRAHPAAPGTCGDCAWLAEACRQVGERVDPRWQACERFEHRIECEPCGACCREAYDTVTLAEDDPFVERHPDLVTREDGHLSLRRIEGRCPPLAGDGRAAAPYRCALYDERPRTCREFERAGEHCLEARRKVGLSW